jgi:hypothetical protein
MDYFFIVLSMTKSEVKDRWGIDVDKESEDMPEANEITGTNTGSSGTNDNVTVKIAYYREQGEIGRYVWTNDTQLEDMPKFYSRRIDGQIQEFETIHQDIQIVDDEGKPINVIPALSPEVNELGIPTGNMMPTAIPYFTPTRYPVVMRENVPLVFRFGGQSDVDIIRDQQDAIKKIVSNIEEKILKGGHIITALTDHNINNHLRESAE